MMFLSLSLFDQKNYISFNKSAEVEIFAIYVIKCLTDLRMNSKKNPRLLLDLLCIHSIRIFWLLLKYELQMTDNCT